MRPVTLLSLLLLVCALPALAALPVTRARALLTLAATPASLRSQLLAYADSATAGDPVGASEALSYAGASFQREGRVDSAIVCHRRAFELLGSEESLLALVDQLLLRRGAGDAAEAIRLLTAARVASDRDAPSALVGRIAWAHFLQGKADTAAKLFAVVEDQLLPRYEWRFRMARVAFTLKDYRRTVNLLLPVAIRARGNDDEVIEMLEQAGKEAGIGPRVKDAVLRGTSAHDQSELALASALGGRLLALTASDGFPLSGLLAPAAPPPHGRPSRRGTTAAAPVHRGPALLAVLLLAPGDSLASGDSLAFALRRHGITTLMLYPRGHGASVDPSCPSPDAWFDREAALQARIARDVRDAVRGVRLATTVDSTRYLVVGVGASATMAVEAATLDPRVKALLLVSPAPEPVDRGPTRARLAQLGLPVFFQAAPDDFDPACAITDILYQAGDRSASRVVDSTRGGRGLAQFRNDPALAARFLAWLDATLQPAAPKPAKAPAPRPTPPVPRPRG
jgi:alpha-beta hydrolase superfamily lysophospholipase